MRPEQYHAEEARKAEALGILEHYIDDIDEKLGSILSHFKVFLGVSDPSRDTTQLGDVYRGLLHIRVECIGRKPKISLNGISDSNLKILESKKAEIEKLFKLGNDIIKKRLSNPNYGK